MASEGKRTSSSAAAIIQGVYEGLAFIRRPAGAIADRLIMFRVHIPTGEVLVDRLAEVLGNVFAGYGKASAFKEGGKDDGQERPPGQAARR